MVFMADTSKLEKPKKKPKVKVSDIELRKDLTDKDGKLIFGKGKKLKKVEFEEEKDFEIGDEMPEIDIKKILKEVKQDDKDDTNSNGDKPAVQPGRPSLSPKERLSRGRGIRHYIRRRV